MEIYAASKREQSAPAKPKAGTAKKGASSSAALQKAQIEEAQMEKFQRTKEALDIIEEQAREEKFRQATSRRQTDPEQEKETEAGGEELKAMAEYLKVMQRCQEIARRLMRGDRVPPEDEQYLMTNDPKSYKLALAARKPNPNPQEWDSVLSEIEGAETTGTAGTAAEGSAGEIRQLFGGDRGDGSGGDGDSGEGGDDAAGG